MNTQQQGTHMAIADQHRHATPLGTVEYLDTGTGMPTLYFHGTGAGNDAALLLEQSLLQSCRLIIPNRPGYYGTSLGPRGCAKYCADLAANLLDYLMINRVAVIGTSGGGPAAACFARCYPDRTAGLVLQCAQSHQWNDGRWLPVGLAPALFLFRHRIFAPFLRWQNWRHAKASNRQPITCLRQMSGSRFSEIRDDLTVVQQITDLTSMTLMCAASPAGIQNDWAIMVGADGVDRRTIMCPTLIVHDRADPLVHFAHAEWAESCIPQSRLLTIHAGGHLIWFGKDFSDMHTQRVQFIRDSLSK
jgi:pimeloyl-ACP methyl ester carboxylesterase